MKGGQVTVRTFIVYVLKSLKDNKLYYGHTNDVNQRVMDHNKGEVKSTKNRRPLVLVYSESFETKEKAIRREKFFKSGFGRAYIKTRLRKNGLIV